MNKGSRKYVAVKERCFAFLQHLNVGGVSIATLPIPPKSKKTIIGTNNNTVAIDCNVGATW